MGTLITWVPQATSIGDDAKQTLLCSSIWQPERNPIFSLLAQFCFSQRKGNAYLDVCSLT